MFEGNCLGKSNEHRKKKQLPEAQKQQNLKTEWDAK